MTNDSKASAHHAVEEKNGPKVLECDFGYADVSDSQTNYASLAMTRSITLRN